ncbi:MAG: cytochrome P460 family protein [Candidatus Sulfotelmatobacter sp.]
MSEFPTKSVAQEQQAQKIETRTAVARIAGFGLIATALAALAVLGAAALYAQGQNKDANNDKYSLVSPGGIAFSDFRGYEDWSAASSARTEAALPDEILKVIVANPTMIKAYKAGVPGNGQPFPDGSMIVKLQWKPKKSTEAPFAVDVPDVFQQAFVMEKDSKRFAKSGGWGYAVFNYDAASDKFSPDPKSLSDCGYACHTPVKAKDYIFHPYQKR